MTLEQRRETPLRMYGGYQQRKQRRQWVQARQVEPQMHHPLRTNAWLVIRYHATAAK